MQASDRFNINSQLEHLQAKYVGTGHADLNRLLEIDCRSALVIYYPSNLIACLSWFKWKSMATDFSIVLVPCVRN
ncbi:hypothetical protein ACJRO7_026779 [Eucalyptus globulus]|uniref:Uncharacterized protein n=1 Tax=Eucalyptus globulus TaxID=34317 RepID=A0ABD3JV99_EUCGL